VSKRLGIALFSIVASFGALYFGIHVAAEAPAAGEHIAGMVKVCVPSLAGAAGAYLWGETRRPSGTAP